jgi:hypothetical protein
VQPVTSDIAVVGRRRKKPVDIAGKQLCHLELIVIEMA